MNVYVIEPCGYGIDFEDCRVVAADSKQEALALLNINEKGKNKRDWFKQPVNVWCLEDIEVASFIPFELERNIVTDEDDEPEASNEEVEQQLRKDLENSEKVYQMCKEDAENRTTSAGLELDYAISKHITDNMKASIRKDLCLSLRKATGCGLGDASTALKESGGDYDKALELCREKVRGYGVLRK